jgi:hypothetical protein
VKKRIDTDGRKHKIRPVNHNNSPEMKVMAYSQIGLARKEGTSRAVQHARYKSGKLVEITFMKKNGKSQSYFLPEELSRMLLPILSNLPPVMLAPVEADEPPLTVADTEALPS